MNELFQAIITAPLQKRQAEWMESVADGLRSLQEVRESDLEALAENDAFLDTVLQASQAAIRTVQQDKLEALRNAVLNSALPNPSDEALRQMFVSMVDAFSGLHVRLLQFLDCPRSWFEKHGLRLPNEPPQTLWALIQRAMPDLEPQKAICEHVCRDLNSRQLLIARSISDPVSDYPYFPSKPRFEQAVYSSANALPGIGTVQYVGQPTAVREWTTDFGRQFLAFISSPVTPN